MFKYSYSQPLCIPLGEGEPIPISKYLVRENMETGEKHQKALYSNGLREPGPWEVLNDRRSHNK